MKQRGELITNFNTMFHIKTRIKKSYYSFLKSRITIGVIMLVIGSTYTFCYGEAKEEWKIISNPIEVQALVAVTPVGEEEEQIPSNPDGLPSKPLSVATSSVATSSVTDRIKKVAKEEGFEQADLLVKIAQCESSLNPLAKNSHSSATGLYQILDMHGLSVSDRQDVEISTKWTIDKIRKNGTSAWNASKSCWN